MAMPSMIAADVLSDAVALAKAVNLQLSGRLRTLRLARRGASVHVVCHVEAEHISARLSLKV